MRDTKFSDEKRKASSCECKSKCLQFEKGLGQQYLNVDFGFNPLLSLTKVFL